MGGNNLYFETGDKIKVDNQKYIVKGLITFYNDADDYRWTEYKIKSINSSTIRWLSIDTTYDEYAIYDQCKYNKTFDESNIISQGYKEADYGQARVTAFRGSVDVEVGDRVRFREFEDISEEKIIAIEIWEDEAEYSKGYYLDEDEIEKLESDNEYSDYNVTNKGYYSNDSGKIKNVFIGIVGIIMVIFIVIGAKSIGKPKQVAMSQFIGSDSNFTYTTSITSDIDNSQKADVYSTKLSVEAAAKAIIDGIGGNTEDVQENIEDSTVAIMTADEYCLVYISETGETLVQISNRKYTYSSNNEPYRSRSSTGRYYRSYYYTRGYASDSDRYSGSKNGYENYSDGNVSTNSSNKYQSYSDSVRQSSAGARTSSGGGTSSGK